MKIEFYSEYKYHEIAVFFFVVEELCIYETQ